MSTLAKACTAVFSIGIAICALWWILVGYGIECRIPTARVHLSKIAAVAPVTPVVASDPEPSAQHYAATAERQANLTLPLVHTSTPTHELYPTRESVVQTKYPGGGGSLTTMNILESVAYPHHPVMLEVSLDMLPTEKDFITEWNGLKVPARFDCDIFNNGAHWGNYFYFYEVPTRWYACYLHEATLKSGLPMEQPVLPFVDDEYQEQVAVYQSALRAKHAYNVVEMGARWGTWGSRSIAMLRKRNPLPYKLLLIEARKSSCEGIQEVMSKNSISYQLECTFATPSNFLAWANQVDHIDLIDMDIQGAEKTLLADAGVWKALNEKVYRLVIGTHSPEIHKQLLAQFKDWFLIVDVPHQPNPGAVQKYLRGYYDPKNPYRFQWNQLVKEGAYTNSVRGKVANADGELIFDNPRFVKSKHFALNDTSLIVDDLI